MKSADGRFGYMDRDGNPLPEGAHLYEVGRFGFRCRCNPNSWCDVNVKNAGYVIPQRNWVLTGSIDAPTLHPSINCGGCWHGYIEQGVFLTTAKKPEVCQ